MIKHAGGSARLLKVGKISTQRGYTLIELLLYVGIVGTLLVGMSTFFATVAEARIKNQTISEVDQQGTAVMQYLSQTIRNATSITSPAAGASGASLTLVVPTGALSPTVFSLSSSVLRVQEGAGATVALTGGKVQITNLTFTNLTRSGTSGVVQISMTLSRVNPSNLNAYDYQRTFVTSVAILK